MHSVPSVDIQNTNPFGPLYVLPVPVIYKSHKKANVLYSHLLSHRIHPGLAYTLLVPR